MYPSGISLSCASPVVRVVRHTSYPPSQPPPSGDEPRGRGPPAVAPFLHCSHCPHCWRRLPRTGRVGVAWRRCSRRRVGSGGRRPICHPRAGSCGGRAPRGPHSVGGWGGDWPSGRGRRLCHAHWFGRDGGMWGDRSRGNVEGWSSGRCWSSGRRGGRCRREGCGWCWCVEGRGGVGGVIASTKHVGRMNWRGRVCRLPRGG